MAQGELTRRACTSPPSQGGDSHHRGAPSNLTSVRVATLFSATRAVQPGLTHCARLRHMPSEDEEPQCFACSGDCLRAADFDRYDIAWGRSISEQREPAWSPARTATRIA